MLIDTANFPLVWISFMKVGPNSDASPFTEFENLLARKQPFVFINDEGIDQEAKEHSHSKEDAKQGTLWMKRNKADLKAYVRAGIYIEPNAAKRFAAKAFTLVFEKFWGYPMLIASNKEEALALAQNLLPRG